MEFIKRYFAMVIDFIAAVIVLIILMFIFAIAGITDMEPNYWIWFAEGFFLYKDCFNGRSIGRIILKQQVIDCKTGQVASPIKCLLRNLFYLLGPIDLLFMLYHGKGRRLGDYAAETQVVQYNHKNIKIKWMESLSIIIGINAFILLISLLTSIYSPRLGLLELL